MGSIFNPIKIFNKYIHVKISKLPLKENVKWQTFIVRLKRISSAVHFIIHPVIGDGNCLFRGYSFGLYNGDEERHSELRNIATASLLQLDNMVNDQQRGNMLLAVNASLEGGLKEFERHCQNNLTLYANQYMARGRTWGGELEAMVLAYVLGRTMIIVRTVGDEEESAVYLPDLTVRRHIVNRQYQQLWVLENNPLVVKYNGRSHFEAITLN
jgi:hypothetical protein